MKRYWPLIIIVIVFSLAVAGGTLLFRSKQRAFKREAEAAEQALKSKIGKPGAEPPHLRGAKNPKATLEEFGDFECPPCGNLSPVLEQLEKDYAQQLRVVFREFPMPMHKHALDAARAAEAAGLQGHFWEMHDMLYHNRFTWPGAADVRVVFADYAKTLKLDVDRFKKDLDGSQVDARIKADKERAASLGVDRTPTLFINDRQVPVTAFNPKGLHETIDGLANPTPTPARPK
jgi:protein-disulfide isomerase